MTEPTQGQLNTGPLYDDLVAERSRYLRANIKFQAQLARLREAAMPFAAHDWMDADLEDDNCKLTKGSGPITVGHWRALRAAISALEPKP